MEDIIAYVGTLAIGWLFGWVKGKIAKSKLISEVIATGQELKNSASDGKLDREEVKRILGKIDDVKDAYKARKK